MKWQVSSRRSRWPGLHTSHFIDSPRTASVTNKPNFMRRPGSGGTIAQNKPNWEGHRWRGVCKTKPIGRREVASRDTPVFPPFHYYIIPVFHPCRLCETKPISSQRARNAIPKAGGLEAATRSCETKPKGGSRQSIVGCRLGERECETKPIDRREAGGRDTPLFPPFHYSIIPVFQPNADCAKRTQFAGRRRQR